MKKFEELQRELIDGFEADNPLSECDIRKRLKEMGFNVQWRLGRGQFFVENELFEVKAVRRKQRHVLRYKSISLIWLGMNEVPNSLSQIFKIHREFKKKKLIDEIEVENQNRAKFTDELKRLNLTLDEFLYVQKLHVQF